MNDATIEWRHIEWVAIIEGKSPLQIEKLREKFFGVDKDEKDEGKPKENA